MPAEKALSAGKHAITARLVDASGKPGIRSTPLNVTIRTATPTTPTLFMGKQSDSGVKGDGTTTYATPVLRGIAQPGKLVSVSIDGVPAGQVKSDAKTGAWKLQAPRLANGVHDVTAVAENLAGIQSAAASFQVTINGLRTVMLDASNGQAVELKASHLLGQGSQGFIVTQVNRGTLQKWSAAKNEWLTIPTKAMKNTDPVSLQQAAAIRKISFTDVVRWTPARGDVGTAATLYICPSDTAGGLTAPTPDPGTVPGKLVNAQVAPLAGGIGQTITWEDPTDGCGCASTRYSIEVTRQDGRTLVYSVPRTVHGVPIVEGGLVEQARVWGATKTGAGVASSYDLQPIAEAATRLAYTVTGAASFIDLGAKARAQLKNSPTPTQFTNSLPLGGSHADLVYLQVDAVPDPTEAAQGLPAGTPMIISSDSSKLTLTQRADLKANPIYASHLFPGTVNGEVLSDQVRAHFQAGETLQFSGTVDARVRTGATIVLEKAQNLADGSLGPWLHEARIPVGADGGFSHKYLVPYGLMSVRVRLEYSRQPTTTTGATSSPSTPISTPINLSNYFNAFGITTPPWQVGNNQGFDGNGNYYNSDYNVDVDGEQNSTVPGAPIVYSGISFPIGPVPTNPNQVGGTEGPQNFVRATGQTITVSVDADKSDYLYLAGAASNGDQLSQTITLNFTDGTTETWTQSFHDWASGGPSQTSSPPWPPAYTTAPGANAKMPVRVATTAPVQNTNLYVTPEIFAGLPTIDGVALAEGDRVLVKNQVLEQYNGIYVASAGTWSRAKDAVDYMELWNASMPVMQGTTNGGKYFWENTDPLEMAGDITFIEITPPLPAPRPFAGEVLLKTEPERVNQLGNLVTTPAHVFGYCRNLHGKQLASITLPNNQNIGILSAVVSKAPVISLDQGFESIVLGTTNLTGVDVMALTIANESNIGAGGGPLTFFFADQPVKGSTTTPTTYTTTQVTVPMGQQTTIAYVAPDSSSQMTFYVQKADGTCVGSNCSTYLTNWNNGSGSKSDWAANITPSLNSQMKAGQRWTMTIQNAGLGYYGYLNSPSGQGLPGGSGNTPAGAQFQLETQNEINDQPPWAVALETDLGAAIALVGIAVLTAGTGDAAVVGADFVDGTVDAVTVASADGTADGSIAERILTDSWYEAMGSLNVQADLADMQAFFEQYGTDLPRIEVLDEVPWADNGIRPNPDAQAAKKATAQAFNQFGFK
ncbi:MAG: Ig-like domain-containing protein [Planctomycetaceae bacterium]